MGLMHHVWNPERESLTGEPRLPANHPNHGNEAFQVSSRYRDLLNIRVKLLRELNDVEAEIAKFEKDMVVP